MVAPSVLTLGTVPNTRALRQACVQAAMEGAVGMPEVTTQYLPSYTVGTEAYGAVRQVVGSAEAVVIGGHKAMAAGLDRLKAAVEGSDVHIVDALWYGGEATYTQIERLVAEPSVQAADAIFAMGGGKVVDTCKMVAHNLGKPLYTFPTIASNCSPVSCISILYNDDGSFREIVQLHVPPAHCFIDTRVIAEAPEELLWAGIGDALSKGYEVQLAARDRNLFHTVAMGVALSHCCTDPLVEYGAAALAACREGRPSYELQEVALDIIISTGLVSNLTTGPNCEYYYNSSIAHCIYNGSTVIPSVVHNHRHGAIVSFGVLCLLTYDGQYGERDRIMAFNHSIGLPVTMAEIGLREEDLPALAQKSSTVTEWTCTPYAMDQKTLMEKILECDTAGKTFLKKFQKTLD